MSIAMTQTGRKNLISQMAGDEHFFSCSVIAPGHLFDLKGQDDADLQT